MQDHNINNPLHLKQNSLQQRAITNDLLNQTQVVGSSTRNFYFVPKQIDLSNQSSVVKKQFNTNSGQISQIRGLSTDLSGSSPSHQLIGSIFNKLSASKPINNKQSNIFTKRDLSMFNPHSKAIQNIVNQSLDSIGLENSFNSINQLPKDNQRHDNAIITPRSRQNSKNKLSRRLGNSLGRNIAPFSTTNQNSNSFKIENTDDAVESQSILNNPSLMNKTHQNNQWNQLMTNMFPNAQISRQQYREQMQQTQSRNQQSRDNNLQFQFVNQETSSQPTKQNVRKHTQDMNIQVTRDDSLEKYCEGNIVTNSSQKTINLNTFLNNFNKTSEDNSQQNIHKQKQISFINQEGNLEEAVRNIQITPIKHSFNPTQDISQASNDFQKSFFNDNHNKDLFVLKLQDDLKHLQNFNCTFDQEINKLLNQNKQQDFLSQLKTREDLLTQLFQKFFKSKHFQQKYGLINCHEKLLFEIFDSLKDQIALLAKFYLRQKSCYEFAYKQIFMKLLGLANRLKIYQKKEQDDKDYEENIFKNLGNLEADFQEYMNMFQDQEDGGKLNQKTEFSGVTKNLRDIKQQNELKASSITQIQRNFDARAIPFDHFQDQVHNKYKVIQNETAKKVLKRFYKKVIVQDQEIQTEQDTKLQDKIEKLRNDFFILKDQKSDLETVYNRTLERFSISEQRRTKLQDQIDQLEEQNDDFMIKIKLLNDDISKQRITYAEQMAKFKETEETLEATKRDMGELFQAKKELEVVVKKQQHAITNLEKKESLSHFESQRNILNQSSYQVSQVRLPDIPNEESKQPSNLITIQQDESLTQEKSKDDKGKQKQKDQYKRQQAITKKEKPIVKSKPDTLKVITKDMRDSKQSPLPANHSGNNSTSRRLTNKQGKQTSELQTPHNLKKSNLMSIDFNSNDPQKVGGFKEQIIDAIIDGEDILNEDDEEEVVSEDLSAEEEFKDQIVETINNNNQTDSYNKLTDEILSPKFTKLQRKPQSIFIPQEVKAVIKEAKHVQTQTEINGLNWVNPKQEVPKIEEWQYPRDRKAEISKNITIMQFSYLSNNSNNISPQRDTRLCSEEDQETPGITLPKLNQLNSTMDSTMSQKFMSFNFNNKGKLMKGGMNQTMRKPQHKDSQNYDDLVIGSPKKRDAALANSFERIDELGPNNYKKGISPAKNEKQGIGKIYKQQRTLRANIPQVNQSNDDQDDLIKLAIINTSNYNKE
eukprot:403363753